jgi:cytochrome c oxidase cbb3-type subunit 3
MADMPADFWSGWIAVITIVSLLGLGWLVFSVYFSPDEEHEKTEGPTWDSNLREGANPAPMWWFWTILFLMVLSVVYLMLYPGLGAFQGALKWSQGGRLNESLVQYEAEFGGLRRLVAGAEVETLQEDPALMASAQRVFDRNCAVCHGYDAAGQASYFPDLTDSEWQWGGSEAQIEQSIRAGRIAVMVGWEVALGADGVDQVAEFMDVLGTGAAVGHPGQTPYNQYCIACHGPDGNGNVEVGAPSLVDDVWLYGNSTEALVHSIAIGRSGVMPAFGDRLDDTQVKLLVALLTRENRVEPQLID